jgi:hypothetical protein
VRLGPAAAESLPGALVIRQARFTSRYGLHSTGGTLMNRFRLAAPALMLGLSLLSGCCSVGHGEILSRLGFGRRCPCEANGSGPVAYEGPDICDGCAAGAGGAGGPMILAPGEGPTLAPPPRLAPEAQPIPAGPTSLSKIK